MNWIIFGLIWLAVGIPYAFWVKWAARHLDVVNYEKASWKQKFCFVHSDEIDLDGVTEIRDISIFWGRTKLHEIVGMIIIATIALPFRLGICLSWWFVFRPKSLVLKILNGIIEFLQWLLKLIDSNRLQIQQIIRWTRRLRAKR